MKIMSAGFVRNLADLYLKFLFRKNGIFPAQWKKHQTEPKPAMPVYRFLPHKTKGEGFFLALIQKNGDGQEKSFLERHSQIEK